MASCAQCGGSLSGSAAFCGGCGAAVSGSARVAGVATATFAAPAETTTATFAPLPPDNGRTITAPGSAGSQLAVNGEAPFRLAYDEVIKASFPLTKRRRPMGSVEATLYVTDSRVVYRATAKNLVSTSLDASEVQISDVAGFEYGQRRGVGPIAAIFAAIIVLASLFAMPLLLIPVGIVIAIWVWVALHSTELQFAIQARNLSTGGIVLRSKKTASQGGFFSVAGLMSPVTRVLAFIGFLDAELARDVSDPDKSREMFEQMGALILDIQARGVLARTEH